jgi:tetrahydromethanopterin S-methyltransferase subunit G
MYVFVCYGWLTMEAAVAEREAGMTEWNDGRLDELGKRVEGIDRKVDAGFARLDKKVDDGFARLDARIDHLGEKVDRGFERFDARFGRLDARFGQFDTKFTQLENKLLDLHVVMFRGSMAIVASVIAAAIGVIAT